MLAVRKCFVLTRVQEERALANQARPVPVAPATETHKRSLTSQHAAPQGTVSVRDWRVALCSEKIV